MKCKVNGYVTNVASSSSMELGLENGFLVWN